MWLVCFQFPEPLVSGQILDWVDTSPGLSVWPKFNAHTTSLPSLKHFDPLKYFWGDCMWLADEPVIGLAITWSHLSGHVFQILKMTFHPSYISDQPKKHPRAPWKVKKSKNDSVGQCFERVKKLVNVFSSIFWVKMLCFSNMNQFRTLVEFLKSTTVKRPCAQKGLKFQNHNFQLQIRGSWKR